jgi:SEC-C motif
MSGIGRNDPCPCGSGRKYKKCCLAASASAPGAYTKAESQSAWAALGAFTSRAEFAGDRAVAEASFFAPLAQGAPDELRRGLIAESQLFFEGWFLCDFLFQGGRTAADLFLEREGARLRSGERRYLERARLAHLRPYEVVGIKPGERLDLLDLWTGQRLEVEERLGSQQLAQWDVLAARILLGAGDRPVIDGAAYAYPVDARGDILKELRRGYRKHKRATPSIDLATFFKRMGRVFYLLWLQHVALRPLPRMVTAEGDDIVLARVVFDVRDREVVAATLAIQHDLERQRDGSYLWLEESAEQRRGLGRVALERHRLIFEATSRPRAERGRAMIETLCGAAVTYRATSYEDVGRAMKRRPSRAAEASEVPPEVQAEVIGRFYEEHYRKWLDEPVPALDGRTPREAATLKSAHPQLVSLLKGMENLAERDRRAGRPAYDFGWMWGELGLPRPT